MTPELAGGRIYCEGLLRGLASLPEDGTEYVLFVRQGITLPELPRRFRTVVAPVGPRSVLWRTAWEYGWLPFRAQAEGCNLLHGLAGNSPAPRRGGFVLTIHDLIYLDFPQSVPLGHRLFLKLIHGRVARAADRVIVPSKWTGQEVVRRLGVQPDRVRLVPYGPGQGFSRVVDQKRVQEVLQKYQIRPPFVVSVARGYPHKNLTGLIRAFSRLPQRKDVQLVLVGDAHRAGPQAQQLAREGGVEEKVRFTGFIPQEELNALYSAATLFAFPSLVEGLGLPVLEAMACGTPVVASDATAVPEAVEDAGVLADARNPDAFASAMARVLDDDHLQEELRAKGLVRARQVSWERCARETAAVYQEVSRQGLMLAAEPRCGQHEHCPSS
jgi:glycosyltransferase involved in cell wall biosynthesis